MQVPRSPTQRPRSPVMGATRARSGSFSALGGAISEFIQPNRRRLYLGSAVNGKWQHSINQPGGPSDCILFDLKHSMKGQGIPMHRLANPTPKLVAEMAGANDPVLASTGAGQINFHIVVSQFIFYERGLFY